MFYYVKKVLILIGTFFIIIEFDELGISYFHPQLYFQYYIADGNIKFYQKSLLLLIFIS